MKAIAGSEQAGDGQKRDDAFARRYGGLALIATGLVVALGALALWQAYGALVFVNAMAMVATCF